MFSLRSPAKLAVLLVALSSTTAITQTAPVQVETMQLTSGEAVLTATYFGTVRARDMASLSYSVRGCVASVSDTARHDRAVAGGTALVTLDDTRAKLDVRAAEARVGDLQAALEERDLGVQAAVADNRRKAEDLDFVEKEFERNSTMLGRGLINETTMEGIERRFMESRFAAERAVEAIANAEAARKRAEISLEIGQLDLEVAKISQRDFTLTAPFDGMLVGFDAKVGDCVQEGALAAEIYDPAKKSVDVFFLISELAAPGAEGLGTGATVGVTRVNGQLCNGTITRLDTQADSETQFVEATVDLDATCAPNFFLNEAVEVSAAQRTIANAYTVPNSAVTRDGRVFLVSDTDTMANAYQAEVVQRGETHTVIRLEGVDGRMLITTGARRLSDGTAVAISGNG